MKIKIAFIFAASIMLSAGFTCLEVQAQQPAPDFAPGEAAKDDGASRENKRQRMLEKFDVNHDGNLDDSEREKMRAAREEKLKQMGMDGGRRGRRGLDGAGGTGGRGGTSGPGGLGDRSAGQGGPGGFSGDGPGRQGMGGGMTDQQRQARRKRMLDRFDANHDGKLDDSERAQLREQMGKMGGGGFRRHRRGGAWGGGGAAPGGGGPNGGAPGSASGGGAPSGPSR